MNLSKFAESETRHPHKEIVDLLSGVEFDADGTPEDVFWPIELFHGELKHEDLAKFSDKRIARAIVDLECEGTVGRKEDPHCWGNEQIGLTELIAASMVPYERLKEEVFKKAKTAGLWPKWRPGSGWHVEDSAGNIVEEGPMWRLNEYLDRRTSGGPAEPVATLGRASDGV